MIIIKNMLVPNSLARVVADAAGVSGSAQRSVGVVADAAGVCGGRCFWWC